MTENKKKKYSFTIRWGVATDTDDIEGMILKKSNSLKCVKIDLKRWFI